MGWTKPLRIIGQVIYRWRDSKTRKTAQRTVSGATFLWLVLESPVCGGIDKDISRELMPHSRACPQLVQIVASHDLTSFDGHLLP